MKAVIVTGGKQYTVSEGDILFIEKLNAEAEATVKFDQVLAVLDGENSKIGAPVVDGAVVEIALDRGVLLGGGREVPLCEVEVELKAGQPEAAVAFAENLAEEFGLRPERKSKFRRALALAEGE